MVKPILHRPFLVAIAGDSGSGKSTFAQGIRRLFGEGNVSSISLDDYHLYDRKERQKRNLTALNPKANNLSLLAEHVKILKKGQSIAKPCYDHSNGSFRAPVKFEPRRVVILEGLLPLHTISLRDLWDVSIYIDPDRHVKEAWKIKRDVEERGHSLKSVLSSIAERQPDYLRWIAPQRRMAEIVVEIKEELSNPHYGKGSPYWIRLTQKITGEKLSNIRLPLNLSRMCHTDAEELYFEYRKGFRGKTPVSKIEINGFISRDMLVEVERRIAELTDNPHSTPLPKGLKTVDEIGIAQLIIAWRVAERMRDIGIF